MHICVQVEALRVATTVWLSFWTGQTDSSPQGNEHSAMFYLVRPSQKGIMISNRYKMT